MPTKKAEHQDLHEAFTAAQGEFPAIHKDKEVSFGRTRFRYASLDAIYAATRPVLNAHGLTITHRLVPADTALLVTTALMWKGGEALESAIPVDLGLPMKDMGASITYAKRYGLAGLLGVAADEDIDAKGLESRGGHQHRAPATGRTIRNMKSSSGKLQPPPISIHENTVKAIREAKDIPGLNAALMAINARPEAERAAYRALMMDAAGRLHAEYNAGRGAYAPIGGNDEEAN